MSTIGDKVTVVRVLRHGGDMNLGQDFPVMLEALIEYTTGFGTVAWKAIYASRGMSVYVFTKTGNIKPGTPLKFLIQNGEMTEYGKEFLAKEGNLA